MLYASTSAANGFDILGHAVQSLLQGVGEEKMPNVLWKMQFVQHARADSKQDLAEATREHVITLSPLTTDVVFEDSVLQDVKHAWQKIMGESEETFMKFEAREGAGEDEEGFD